MIRALLAGCLFCATLAAASAAQTRLSPEQQEQYRRLASEFVAPCCWRAPLTSHLSPQADQARRELSELVRAGHSDAEIREAFIGSYGEAILLVPEGERAQWLFATPFAVTLVAIGLCGWFLASLLRRRHYRIENGRTALAEVDEADLQW